MKKKNILAIAMIPAFALAFLGANMASAHSFGWMRNIAPDEVATMTTQKFTHQAELLGVSVETIKNGWAEGKNLWEIAEENGITKEALQTKMQTERKTMMTEHLNSLVEKGVITREQADKKLAVMEARGFGSGQGAKMEGGGRGMGRMNKGFNW